MSLNPVAFHIGSFPVKWYGLAYMLGFLATLFLGKRLLKTRHQNPLIIDDFLLYAMIGVIAGGRLGHVFLYEWTYYQYNITEIFWIWEGGMAFHGGFAGVLVALFIFCHQRKISPFMLGDILGCTAPIGLGLGRLANFVNGELWGKPTTHVFGMVFPLSGDTLTRHPSQLYEAALEGVLLYVILNLLNRQPAIRNKTGVLAFTFITLYGLCRFVGEYWREPDGLALWNTLSLGQLYSLPMIIGGFGFLVWRYKQS
jgi:phosphatidylglycerol:prolipoprotein diacylglycerol transferase